MIDRYLIGFAEISRPVSNEKYQISALCLRSVSEFWRKKIQIIFWIYHSRSIFQLERRAIEFAGHRWSVQYHQSMLTYAIGFRCSARISRWGRSNLGSDGSNESIPRASWTRTRAQWPRMTWGLDWTFLGRIKFISKSSVSIRFSICSQLREILSGSSEPLF